MFLQAKNYICARKWVYVLSYEYKSSFFTLFLLLDVGTDAAVAIFI